MKEKESKMEKEEIYFLEDVTDDDFQEEGLKPVMTHTKSHSG